MFPTLRFFTQSSSLPGLNIKPGAWLVPPSTVRYVCGLLVPLLGDADLWANFADDDARTDGHQARDEPGTRK
jgi:hypothetical protein